MTNARLHNRLRPDDVGVEISAPPASIGLTKPDSAANCLLTSPPRLSTEAHFGGYFFAHDHDR